MTQKQQLESIPVLCTKVLWYATAAADNAEVTSHDFVGHTPRTVKTPFNQQKPLQTFREASTHVNSLCRSVTAREWFVPHSTFTGLPASAGRHTCAPEYHHHHGGSSSSSSSSSSIAGALLLPHPTRTLLHFFLAQSNHVLISACIMHVKEGGNHENTRKRSTHDRH